MTAIVRLIRPTHWIKNGFVFAPLVFSGNLFMPDLFLLTFLAAVLFSLLASAVYVFNDINDAPADREHRKKKFRPIASGAVSLPVAWGLFAVLLAAVVAGCLALLETAPYLSLILAIYALINLAYSLGLKHVQLVELFAVSSGFILRLLAGALTTGIPVSNWILITTALVSLMLVVGKRRADLAQNNDPGTMRKAMSGYDIRYLDGLMIMMSATTLVAYLMFCTSEYGEEKFGEWVVFTSVFVAFGIFRFLQIVIVNDGGDAPTSIVLKDRMMLGTMLGWIFSFVFIIYGDRILGFMA